MGLSPPRRIFLYYITLQVLVNLGESKRAAVILALLLDVIIYRP